MRSHSIFCSHLVCGAGLSLAKSMSHGLLMGFEVSFLTTYCVCPVENLRILLKDVQSVNIQLCLNICTVVSVFKH